MRTVRRFGLLLATALTLASCGDANLLALPQGLPGTWMAEPYRWDDGWSPKRMDRVLTFQPDGGYMWEVLSYGGYGKPESELTFYHRVIGTYRLNGDQLQVRITTRITADSFYGSLTPTLEQVQPRWDDHGTLQLLGDRLWHTYITYPADAPETTVEVYARVK
jgi:hypothetical protein